MNPLRLAVRFAVTSPADDLSGAIETFHRLIQRGHLEGLVLDVADYQHVPQGPGVVLVGHDVDYAINDEAFTAIRKRSTGDDAATQLRDALRMGLAALDAIEDDPSLSVGVDRGRFTVAAYDRAAGARDELEAALRMAVEGVVAELYGDAATVTTVEVQDARRAPEVRVEAGQVDHAAVLAALGGNRSPGQSPWDIAVEELARLRDGGEAFTLLDVREASEYEIVNLGGTLIPLGELGDRLDELDQDGKVVVHCRSGRRGAEAVASLREAGFTDAWNVNGALAAWRERIDPTVPMY